MGSASLQLPFRLSAVGTARRWAVEQCLEHLPDEAVQQVVELLTSELVANAVTHGAEPVTVAVECAPDTVCVAVSDGSDHQPVRRDVDLEATGGRGVALVDALASAWGVRTGAEGIGKITWFRCDTRV